MTGTRRCLGALLLIALALPLHAQEDPEVAAKKLVTRMAASTPTEVWRVSDEAIRLGTEARDVFREGLKHEKPLVAYACARTLLRLGDEDAAIESLLELLGNTDAEEARWLCVDLLGEEEIEEAEEALVKLLGEPLAATVRARVARALYRCSLDARVKAIDALRGILVSTRLESRGKAALILAQLGYIEPARSVLQELSQEPSHRGELATSYLKMDLLRRSMAHIGPRKEEPKKNETKKDATDLKLLQEVIHLVRKYHQDGDRFDPEKLEGLAARGLLEAIDPHSTFLTPSDKADWDFDLNPTYGGVGAYVNIDDEGRMFIVRPIYSGPAYRSDLKSGDRILEIDGWNATGHELNEITDRLKGPAGTKVKIQVWRRGWSRPREYTIERARIQIPTVNWELLPGGVAYVQLTTFGQETPEELEVALEALEAKGMKSLVLDLRSNSGGYLDAAQEIAGKFLDGRQEIVSWEGRNKEIAPRRVLFTKNPKTIRRMPLVILVDRWSASASEIVAGAMQDHKRGFLIGDRTFGKGSVQRFLELDSRPSEAFVDEARKNGRWDHREPYVDQNGNKQWDPGEPFRDIAFKNGAWNPGEPFVDENGNGRWDEVEKYTDQDGDGKYTPAERFRDANNNGRYDEGPRVKMTIARYYLPSGRSIHKERDADGKVVNEGGIAPDETISERTREGWKVEEYTKIWESKKVEEYVLGLEKKDPEKVKSLAVSDAQDWKSYPGFVELYAALETPLTKDDVRVFLRNEIRRHASDLRGREHVADFQEDPQLQRAIFHALGRQGTTLSEVGAYQSFEKNLPEPVKPKPASK